MREVQIEDLLGREPVKLDNQRVNEFVRGKVVLVTGGGGSIGSELCRQIAAQGPKRLIILDIAERTRRMSCKTILCIFTGGISR